MDYQNAIVGMLDDPDDLLARAMEAIALVRHHGGRVGYVRVASPNREADVHSFLIERIFPRQADVITSARLGDLLSASQQTSGQGWPARPARA